MAGMEGIRPGLLHIHITRHQLVRASLVVTMETGALPECFQDSWPAIQRIMADNFQPKFSFLRTRRNRSGRKPQKQNKKKQNKKTKEEQIENN